MIQSNTRYPVELLDRAKDAAAWEDLTISDYMRSALHRRVKGTEAAKARELGEKPK